MPAGFRVEVFAENVGNARRLALGPQGTVFVGTQYAGKVHAVVDREQRLQGRPCRDRSPKVSATEWRRGAERRALCRDHSQILRFDDIEKHLDAPPASVVVKDNLPNPKPGPHWKFIGFGPDDMLYMTVGVDVQRLRAAAR